jgi:hypothetical protein
MQKKGSLAGAWSPPEGRAAGAGLAGKLAGEPASQLRLLQKIMARLSFSWVEQHFPPSAPPHPHLVVPKHAAGYASFQGPHAQGCRSGHKAGAWFSLGTGRNNHTTTNDARVG